MLLLDWIAQNGSSHPKHHGLHHPIFVCLLHYSVVMAQSWFAHDLLFMLFEIPLASSSSFRHLATTTNDQNHVVIQHFNYDSTIRADDRIRHNEIACPDHQMGRWYTTASLLLLYSVWLLIWRLFSLLPPRNSSQQYQYYLGSFSSTAAVLYEYCWLCNVTLVLSAVALFHHRPVIAQAFCVTVGIDQLLWYVDLLVYFSFGFFPVGVSRYLFRSDTTLTVRITSSHHLWTIPLLLWTTNGIHWLAFPLSLILMVANVLLSRWMIPFQLGESNVKQNPVDQQRYLNVNLSYELWPDVKIWLIQINYDNPSMGLYLFRLFSRWGAFNAMVFAVLYGACHYWFDPQIMYACMRQHQTVGISFLAKTFVDR